MIICSIDTVGLHAADSALGAEDVCMSRADKFSGAGILVGAVGNKQMSV